MALTSSSSYLPHQTKVIMHMAAWRPQANCTSVDTEAFYDTEEANMKKQAAKYCSSCPVQNQCLYTAIVIDERYGVWGGFTPRQRKILNRNLRAVARSKGLDLDSWNKDADNFVFQNTSLESAYNFLT